MNKVNNNLCYCSYKLRALQSFEPVSIGLVEALAQAGLQNRRTHLRLLDSKLIKQLGQTLQDIFSNNRCADETKN